MKKSELSQIIKEEIRKVLSEESYISYGEQEAIDEIMSNKQIQSSLKKLPGFERIIGLSEEKLNIVFTNERSAKTAVAFLDKHVPGPYYAPKKSGNLFIIKIDADNPAQHPSY